MHNLLKSHKYNIENHVFHFDGVSECERKCVSRFWLFGNLVISKVLKVFWK